MADDVPFVPDERSLRQVSPLTLDTDAGPLDLLAAPEGAPTYAQMRERAERLEVFGTSLLVAGLDDLLAMKRAAGRPKDLLDLQELEAIRRLRPAVRPDSAS